MLTLFCCKKIEFSIRALPTRVFITEVFFLQFVLLSINISSAGIYHSLELSTQQPWETSLRVQKTGIQQRDYPRLADELVIDSWPLWINSSLRNVNIYLSLFLSIYLFVFLSVHQFSYHIFLYIYYMIFISIYISVFFNYLIGSLES